MAKILVVDDNIATVSLLESMLQIAGYEVIFAYDGPTGIQKAQAEKPTLVLLDVMMPQMDGIAVCTALRKDPATASIPIVVLSAKTDEESVKRALAAGANEYQIKPFNIEKLMKVVEKYADTK
jgi:CheY-like chemotaxis protein